MQRLINSLMPILLAALVIVALFFGIMLLFYLFLFIMLAGLGLYLFNWVKFKFFPPKIRSHAKPSSQQSGRIIDADEWEEKK